MNRFCLLIGWAGLIVNLAACTQAQPQTAQRIPFTVLYESQQCGLSIQSTDWITSRSALKMMMQPPRQQLDSAPDPLDAVLEQVDFATQQLLLIGWGQQPTAGYDIRIEGDHATLTGDQLQLPVRFIAPDPERMHAQVVTSTCVLLRVESTVSETQVSLLPTR